MIIIGILLILVLYELDELKHKIDDLKIQQEQLNTIQNQLANILSNTSTMRSIYEEARRNNWYE